MAKLFKTAGLGDGIGQGLDSQSPSNMSCF
jgi:hypothetical protein